MPGKDILEFKLQASGFGVPSQPNNRGDELKRRAIDPEVIFEEARSGSFNALLREHVVQADDWQHREVADFVHGWARRFTSEFHLEIDSPAIRICPLRSTTLGHYHLGRNSFGLRHEIAINDRHLARPVAALLLTLFHELLHEWQFQYGKPGRGNYHNAEFRTKAARYGITIDASGRTTAVEDGLFVRFLLKHGIDVRGLLAGRGGQADTALTGSKLKKWSCGCTNVRCAVKLDAQCLKCGSPFELAGAAW